MQHGFTRPVNRATYLAPTILMVAATADSRSSTSSITSSSSSSSNSSGSSQGDRDVAALLSYYLASDVAGAALDTAAVLDPDLGACVLGSLGVCCRCAPAVSIVLRLASCVVLMTLVRNARRHGAGSPRPDGAGAVGGRRLRPR